ncbi:MAG: family 78 glycoside hydrolase catalytic domain [Protaetiibacter sp.]
MPLPSVPTAYALRVDGRHDPLTVAVAAPRLQWRMRGDRTPRYVRVQAARTAGALLAGDADLWDSATLSYTGPAVDWAGAALASGSTVYWRVGLGLEEDDLAWSAPAVFGTAVAADDWAGAAWVTHPALARGATEAPVPALELSFEAPADLIDARLHLAIAGAGDVTINGEPAIPDLLVTGYAVYRERVPAAAWDVTSAIRAGETNTLRIAIGPGIAWVAPTARYSKLVAEHLPPRALAKLTLDARSGTSHLVSGGHWASALTATTSAHWFAGEDHDATGGDHDVRPAEVLGDATLHRVWWSEQPGLRVTDTLSAVGVAAFADGTRVYDFGVNIAGRPRIELDAEAGLELRLWPAELLRDDGRADQRSTGSPIYDSYLTRAGHQSWAPRHVYHGFRYLEVRGVSANAPDPVVTAEVIRAANHPSGEFATDDVFLNALETVIDRAIQGNMFSVFTDCPNREKLGWIEQLYLCFDVLQRHYDVSAQLRDALVHMTDSQLASGSVPSIAPETVDFSGHPWGDDPNAFREDPNWGGALVHLPWLLYLGDGDLRPARAVWPAIRRYLGFLASRETEGVLDFGLGDWIALDETTPRAMVASFGYLRILATAARMASVLGDESASAELQAAEDRVRSAFAAAFDRGDGVWGSGSQGSLALALDSGVVPASDRARVVDRLLGVIAANEGRLSVGENTWPSLLRVLHAAGRDDVTDALVHDSTGPGYGWQLAHGATALPETWFGATGARNDNSQNHFMLGMVYDWMSQTVAGLAQHPGSVGWRRAVVAPTPTPSVRAARTAYESPLGRYDLDWDARDGFHLTVTIPPGGSAEVVLPDGSGPFEVGPGTWTFGA